MKRGKLIQWLHGFGRSHSAGRPRSHGSHTLSPSRRQPYLLRPRLEQLEERTLLSVVYVDDTATGLNNGTSWANAYKSLQSALTPAVPGTEIHVGQGTYKPTTGPDRTISFALKNNVAIYGGYAGVGANDPDSRNVALFPSILSGDIGTVGNATDNSYHVVVGGGTYATALLDGFTITAGNANSSGTSPWGRGGGMYNVVSSPTVANCIFAANAAASPDGAGGGMFNSSSSFPTLTNCTFTANSAGSGGGMLNDFSSPTLTNCAFTANSTGSGIGGGMHNYYSNPILITCAFTGNTAAWGGGMYNVSSTPTLTNCVFTANVSTGSNGGGGMFNGSSSPTLTNCTFTANSATSGGGMYSDSSSPTLTNCTIVANSATLGGGMANYHSSNPKLNNCILWANAASNGSQIYDNSSNTLVTYGDIQGGYPGAWNISVDPQFARAPTWGLDGKWGTADDDYGDLRLRLISPCIDAGKNAAVPAGVTTDLAGNPRFVDIPAKTDTGVGTVPVVDLGAYEVRAAVQAWAAGPYRVWEGSSIVLAGTGYSPSALPVSYAWDFDGDGQYDDATGPSPVFSAVGMTSQTLIIGLRVTDTSGASDTQSAVLRVFPPVYVDDSATGLNNGTSWANAFTDLQSALAKAVVGDQIRVAQGIYKPTTGTDRTISFALKTGVAIYGGYAGVGASDPDVRSVSLSPSILSGDIGTAGIVADNSYHVVVASGANATAVLDGFTITAGNANGASPKDVGGGMYNSSGSPTLANCTFTANSANSGGGMYNASSSPSLTNCTFTASSASDSGGGMYNASSSSPTLTNCTFTANSATNSGGGMYNLYSSPTLTNCTFTANSANNNPGGGMYNSSSSSPTLTNCTFTANSANNNSGGGMYNSSSSTPTLTNCTFTANSAGSGGGMYNYSSSPTLANCTLTANSANYSGGAIYNGGGAPKLTNCILSANTASSGGQLYDNTSTVAVTYCDIQGGYSGPGNINADPQFVRNPSPGRDGTWGTADDDYGDLRLLTTSPCIDAGNNAAVPAGITTDLAGNPRFADVPAIANTGTGTAPIVDLGAYESPNPAFAVSGSGGFSLGLTADHANIQVVAPAGSYNYAVAVLSSIAFTGGAGDDRLTLDFTNGKPLPSGGVRFDAALQSSGDSLVVQGTASGQQVTLEGSKVRLDGQEILSLTGVEFFGFDLGEQPSGMLPGISGLVKAGPGTLTLAGTNAYLGDTTVLGGKLIVTGAEALPGTTSLVINGGSVVLDTGLNQAVKLSGLRLNLGTRSAATSTATSSVSTSTRTTTPAAQPAAAIVPLAVDSLTLAATPQDTLATEMEATVPAIVAAPMIAGCRPCFSTASVPAADPVTAGPHPASRRGRGVSVAAVAQKPMVPLIKTHAGKVAVSTRALAPNAVPPQQRRARDAALQAVVSPHLAADLAWRRVVGRVQSRVHVSQGTVDSILAKDWQW